MKVSNFKFQVSRRALATLAALFILCRLAFVVTAADVLVSARDFQVGVMPGRTATITPTAARSSSPHVIVLEPRSLGLTNGVATFTNVVAGYYKLNISGAPPTALRLLVPETNGTVNAAFIVSTDTNAVVAGSTTLAWSASASDARYASQSWVTNYVSTNVISTAQQTNFPASAITNQLQPAQIAGTLTNNTTGTASYADNSGYANTAGVADTASAVASTDLPPTRYVGMDDDSATTLTRDGSLWTNIPAAGVTGAPWLTNRQSGVTLASTTNTGTSSFEGSLKTYYWGYVFSEKTSFEIHAQSNTNSTEEYMGVRRIGYSVEAPPFKPYPDSFRIYDSGRAAAKNLRIWNLDTDDAYAIAPTNFIALSLNGGLRFNLNMQQDSTNPITSYYDEFGVGYDYNEGDGPETVISLPDKTFKYNWSFPDGVSGNGSGLTNLPAAQLTGTASTLTATNVTVLNLMRATNYAGAIKITNPAPSAAPIISSVNYSNSTSALIITPSGNVGLNGNPSFMLDVGGKSTTHSKATIRTGYDLILGGSWQNGDGIGYNATPTETNNTYIRTANNGASRLAFDDGAFIFTTGVSNGASTAFIPTARMKILNTGEMGIGTVTPSTILHVAGTVTATNFVSSGGFSIILTNATGSNSVLGMVVTMGATSFSYNAAPINSIMPIGIVAEPGIANGAPVKIITSGVAQVLIDDQSTTNWSGSWLGVSAQIAGRAKVLSGPANTGDHETEVGHGCKNHAYATSASITNLSWGVIHIGR